MAGTVLARRFVSLDAGEEKVSSKTADFSLTEGEKNPQISLLNMLYWGSHHLYSGWTVRFPKTQKLLIPVRTVYYNERIQAKFNMGKRYMGQSSGETKYKLPGVFSPWSSRDPSNSPGKDVCQKKKNKTATWEAHPSVSVQGFYWPHALQPPLPQANTR